MCLRLAHPIQATARIRNLLLQDVIYFKLLNHGSVTALVQTASPYCSRLPYLVLCLENYLFSCEALLVPEPNQVW